MKMSRCTRLCTVRSWAGCSALFGLFACLAVAGCGGTANLPGQQPDRATNGSHELKGAADFSVAAKEPGAAETKRSADYSLTAKELDAEYQNGLPPFYVPGAVRVGSTATDVSSGRRGEAESARGLISPYSAGVRYPSEP